MKTSNREGRPANCHGSAVSDTISHGLMTRLSFSAVFGKDLSEMKSIKLLNKNGIFTRNASAIK